MVIVVKLRAAIVVVVVFTIQIVAALIIVMEKDYISTPVEELLSNFTYEYLNI